jgi:hypothetical protein
MKWCCYVILLVFGCIHLYAEAVPGYIIQLNGDTIKGKIDILIVKEKDRTFCPQCGGVRLDKLTFDIRFAKEGQDYSKIDCQKLKGFGFNYAGKDHNFEVFNVKANQQISPIFPDGTVVPDGIYFIRREEEDSIPFYGLYLEDDRDYTIKPSPVQPKAQDVNIGQRRIEKYLVVKHPTKGMLYISRGLDIPKKQVAKFCKYLNFEEAFITKLEDRKYLVEELFRKYNDWKKVP